MLVSKRTCSGLDRCYAQMRTWSHRFGGVFLIGLGLGLGRLRRGDCLAPHQGLTCPKHRVVGVALTFRHGEDNGDLRETAAAC